MSKRYSVVGASNLALLEELVNKALEDGCELIGGVCVESVLIQDEVARYYYQAVTFEDQSDDQ